MSANSMLGEARGIHVVGVGGAGMSALALLLSERGHQVSGSDVRVTSQTEFLAGHGVTITIGHRPRTVHGAQLVTFSPAVRADNVELVEAERCGISVARRGEVLAALVAERRTLAVAGTHGKTTTSSMLAEIARRELGDPSYLIGEPLVATGRNAHYGTDDLLVMEADESYGTFTTMAPAIVGITNIEADHLDHYGTEAALVSAFTALIERTTEHAVVWGDDPLAASVGRRTGALSVGCSPESSYVVSGIVTEPRRSAFDLSGRNGSTLAISLAVGGLHNVANAAVAASMADLAGFSHDAIVEGLGAFGGVPRRYEQRGVVRGVTLIDDYAHLPTEVATTVTAACSSGFSKVIVVFQPHRYTRTQHVGAQFGSSFDGADVVVVTPLYEAGEAAISGISSAIVSNAVREDGSVAQVIDVESLEEASEVAAGLATHGSVILTLGAGDSTMVPDLVAAVLEGQ